MLVKLAKEVLEKYPHTQIGYVVAQIDVAQANEFTENIKQRLLKYLTDNNITEKNYSSHPQISGWRNVFKEMGVSHKTNRSSVEALVKRTVSGAKMWGISNVVDLYNCCSVLSLLPMGGYDIDLIKDNIYLRFGCNGETFEPLGMNDPITVDNKHVVYADEERVICWLWNFRDSKHTSIRETTKRAIFFLDSAFPMSHIKMEDALMLFEEGLTKINGTVITHNGILSKDNAHVDIKLDVNNKTIKDGAQGLFDALLFKKEKLNPNTTNKTVCNKQHAKETPKIEKVVQTPFVPVSASELTSNNWAVFFSSTGNLDKLKEIFEQKPALLECTDWSKSTLLMHAALGDHDKVAAFLVQSVPRMVDAKNQFGETAYDIALKNHNNKVLGVLKPQDANANSKNNEVNNNQVPFKPISSGGDDKSINHEVFNSICTFLNKNGVEYTIEVHEPPYTCPTEGKAILMKIDDDFHLFAYTASRRIKSKSIKKQFNAKKMRFATSEELFDLFKLVPGSVPTFGEPILPIKIFLDKQMITENKEITLSLGSVSHYAIMKMSDYLRIAKYETFEFTEE